jgi:hypothetical protein
MPERHKRAFRVAGVPYYQTSGFWSTIGFGVLSDDLVERVIRGDFRHRRRR